MDVRHAIAAWMALVIVFQILSVILELGTGRDGSVELLPDFSAHTRHQAATI